MKLLVTGAIGMLGTKVVADATAKGHEVVAADIAECDLTDADATTAFLASVAPDAVINCAAYTAVDKAESDEDTAMAVNGHAAGNLARAAAAVNARIVHVSTDYVFQGDKPDDARPWFEDDPTGPVGAYGRTKLAGEKLIAAGNDQHAIVRTAWLFGVDGPNFVDTMLRVGDEKGAVSVVDDQVGCPTWAGHLAPALVDLAGDRDRTGVFHGAGGGRCSWYEFAVEIFKRAGRDSVEVSPTDSQAFVRPAPRPAWSVMGTMRDPGVVLPDWTEGLQGHLDERKTQ